MNLKNTVLVFALMFLVLISVSSVAAGENQTINDHVYGDSDNEAKIIAEDVNVKYSPYNQFTATLEDKDGYEIYGENLKIVWNDGKRESLYEWDDDYGYNTYIDRDVGKYKFTIHLIDSDYKAKPVTINVKIAKANVKLTAKKWVSTTKQYTTLKAFVKDSDGNRVDEGTAKFIINGKKYTVKVKDGVAIKKIKLTKAKNYNYKVTFTSKNYNSKTASSTVYVKKAKKYYTLKYQKYSVKLSYNKYVKILDAKNNNKFGYADVDTGIKRSPEIGGGHYYVGLSTNDEYHTYYGYPIHDYVFLRASSYLGLKKVSLYTTNF